MWCTMRPFRVFSQDNSPTPQFQENTFVMLHFYKVILAQYNETW